MQKNLLLCLFITVCLSSCSHREIQLDAVRQSSDLLHCYKVYGSSFKSIEEENEIIIQTGEIDTTDEQKPITAAIVNIKNTEVVLNLSGTKMLDGKIIEQYRNNEYTLVLSYSEESKGIYKGLCTISSGKLMSVYNITGINNVHL